MLTVQCVKIVMAMAMLQAKLMYAITCRSIPFERERKKESERLLAERFESVDWQLRIGYILHNMRLCMCLRQWDCVENCQRKWHKIECVSPSKRANALSLFGHWPNINFPIAFGEQWTSNNRCQIWFYSLLAREMLSYCRWWWYDECE